MKQKHLLSKITEDFFLMVEKKLAFRRNNFIIVGAIILFLFSSTSKAQIVNTESFDGTTFVPTGWTNLSTSGTAVWARSTSGSNPSQSPHTGAGEAYFNSYNASTGVRALITPAFNLSGNTSGAAVSFWMYRDNGYNTTADKVDVYYNTSASLTSAVLLGTVKRAIGLTPTVTANGWYQYSFTIPSTVTNTTTYLILNATSAYGNNIFLDDVSWTAYPPLCSGTPPTPSIAISATAGCPGNAITLSTLGSSNLAGIVNQWQSSTSLGGTYSNITGANGTSYATSTTSTTYYRMLSSCTVSALSATTSVVSYSLVNPGPCVCNSYSAIGATSTSDEEILGVTFGSLSNVSSCTTTAPGAGSVGQKYSNYAGFLTAPDVCNGGTVNFTVNLGTCGGWYGVGMNIYIDYNQNGSFSDLGELVYSVASATQGLNISTITIPVTALSGLTRMRVVAVEGSVPGPNTSYTWGETEDYCININAQPTLTLSANAGSICPGAAFVITSSGASTYTYSGGSIPLTGATVTLSPIANTIYTVNGTSSIGCVTTGSNALTATISTLASPNLVASASPTSYCTGLSTNLTVSGANTFTWIAPSSNASLISVSPTVTTIYTVSGTGTNVCNGFNTVTVTVFPRPTITAASGSICAGNTFTIIPSGAVSYTYSNGTNTISPLSSTVLGVVGTSSDGCVSTTSAAVNITLVPLPVVSVNSGTACSGDIFHFTLSGATSYTYVGGYTNPLITSTSGTYGVIGTDSTGCVSLPAVSNLTIYSLPVINVVATPSNMTICNTQTLSLTASGAVSYNWNNVAQGTTFASTPSVSGSYFVVGTDVNGCLGATNVSYNVNPLPPLSLAGSTFVCQGGSSTITAGGALTYSWSNAAATTSSLIVTPTVTTVYSVVGTNTFGCTKSKTLTVVVNTIVIHQLPDTALCIGNSINVSATGGVSYTWTPVSSIFSALNITPSVTATYSYHTIDSKSCHHMGMITVSVNALPAITATGSQSMICSGETATITAAGGTSYMWTSPTATTGAMLVVHPVNTMVYMVTGTDNNGCASTTSVSLVVSKCTGVNQIASEVTGLSIYPNPNGGLFTVELANGFEKNIQIIDITGRIIRSEKTSEDKIDMHMTELANGIYYVKIQSNTSVSIVKVIKQ